MGREKWKTSCDKSGMQRRRLGLDAGERGDALFATTDAEVDASQDDESDEDPDVDVPEVLEDAKVLDASGKDDRDASGAGIEIERFSAKLNDSDGRDADETNVEQEGVHEGTSSLHGMDGEDEGDAEAELEVAVDYAEHEVERVDSVEDDTKEGPDSVHSREPVVEEALDTEDGVDEDVDEPGDRQECSQNAEHQVRPVPQNADAVGLVRLNSLIPLLFEHVNFVTPVVVDCTTRILATIFNSIFDERVTDLSDQDLTVSELCIRDGLGTKTPSGEEVNGRRYEADTTENAEEETSEDGEHSDEVEDEGQLEVLSARVVGEATLSARATSDSARRSDERGVLEDTRHLRYGEEEVRNNSNDGEDDDEDDEAAES